MAKSLNKVMLIGNVGKIEALASQKGNMVKVSLATSSSWKDKNNGEEVQHTEWHNIVFFGKLASIADDYIKKGSKIYVEGSLKTNKYQADDGSDRYSTSIIAKELLLLSKKEEGGEPKGNFKPKEDAYSSPSPDYDDEIPF